MFGMMQEKPQPSIRHIQATGRAALKLGTTTIAWAVRPRTRDQSGESTAPGKLCCQRRNHRHGKPLWRENWPRAKIISCATLCPEKKKKSSIMRQTRASRNRVFFVMTGKIWKYQNDQNKGAMDGTDRLGKNCKSCWNGNGYIVCL